MAWVPTTVEDHFADEFIRSAEGVEQADSVLQEARDALAAADEGISTPEQNAEMCLRSLHKPIGRMIHALNGMYDALGFAKPYAGHREGDD